MIYCPKCRGTYFIIHHTVGGPEGSVLLECCSMGPGKQVYPGQAMFSAPYPEPCGARWTELEALLLSETNIPRR